MLGYSDEMEKRGWERILAEKIPDGQPLPSPAILFQKIEDEQIEGEIQKLKELSLTNCQERKKSCGGFQAARTFPLKPAVTIEDVKKLDLRVGVIVKS